MVFNDELGQLLPDIAELANMDGVRSGLDALLEFIGRFEAWGNESKTEPMGKICIMICSLSLKSILTNSRATSTDEAVSDSSNQ